MGSEYEASGRYAEGGPPRRTKRDLPTPATASAAVRGLPLRTLPRVARLARAGRFRAKRMLPRPQLVW